jgi:hypothetical protein
VQLKETRNISLDPEVVKAVDEETEKGKFCLSKWVNKALKVEFKDSLDVKS